MKYLKFLAPESSWSSRVTHYLTLSRHYINIWLNLREKHDFLSWRRTSSSSVSNTAAVRSRWRPFSALENLFASLRILRATSLLAAETAQIPMPCYFQLVKKTGKSKFTGLLKCFGWWNPTLNRHHVDLRFRSLQLYYYICVTILLFWPKCALVLRCYSNPAKEMKATLNLTKVFLLTRVHF